MISSPNISLIKSQKELGSFCDQYGLRKLFLLQEWKRNFFSLFLRKWSFQKQISSQSHLLNFQNENFWINEFLKLQILPVENVNKHVIIPIYVQTWTSYSLWTWTSLSTSGWFRCWKLWKLWLTSHDPPIPLRSGVSLD